jgi:hypothetical protein
MSGDTKKHALGSSVSVKGSVRASVAKEVKDFYQRKGMPASYYRKQYGIGEGMRVQSQSRPRDGRLLSK